MEVKFLTTPIFSQSCTQRFAQNDAFCSRFKSLFVRAPNNPHARNNWQQCLSLASASFHNNKIHRATKTTEQRKPNSNGFVLPHYLSTVLTISTLFSLILDGYVNSKTTLKQFVKQYSHVLKSKVQKEVEEDAKCLSQQMPCVTSYEMEKQVQDVYTISKFQEF